MYDELIKRLRETSVDFGESDHVSVMMIEAADAIEELVEERDMYIKAMADEHNRAARLAWEHRWIPVTERLPDYGEVVQITDGIEVGHGYLEGVNTTVGIALLWHSPFCDIDEEHITHWMPLPEPPKDGET